MTAIQNMMLSVCFGFVVGTLVGEAVSIVRLVIKDRRERKRKKSEEAQ